MDMETHHRKRSSCTQITENLTRYIASSPADAYLPSVPELCAAYRCSSKTVIRALRELSEKGLIEVLHGRRTVIRGRAGYDHYGRAVQRICKLLTDQISDGTIMAGSSLPKISSMAESMKCSASTVSAALQRMAKDGLLHKSGSRWIAGSCTSSPAGSSYDPVNVLFGPDAPVVLLLLPEIKAAGTLNYLFLYPFFDVFRKELEKFRISLPMVSILPDQSGDDSSLYSKTHAVWAAGNDEIDGYVKKLGSRYYGTYIPYIDTRQVPDEVFIRTVNNLLRYRKPVIWTDEKVPTPESRNVLYRAIAGGGRNQRRNLHYLYNDETAAVRILLERLKAEGHENIGIIDNYSFRPDREWAHSRIVLLTGIASELGMAARTARDPFEVGYLDTENITKATQRLADVASGMGSGSREIIFNHVPALRELLKPGTHGPGCTALVALNDDAAHYYYIALLLAEYRIPMDVSFASFDNAGHVRYYPLSTIDFGLERYGYLAAHRFIGDIPVRLPSYVNQIGKPVLMDRGSIGRARKAATTPFRGRTAAHPFNSSGYDE
jgi:DNA-binding transcriptional regulator YhcF (GntR family)